MPKGNTADKPKPSRQELKQLELDNNVRRLASQAGRAALILAESSDPSVQNIRTGVGTTYEVLPQPGGLVEFANVVAHGILRDREHERGPATMGVSIARTHDPSGVTGYELTVYWRQDNQAASITIQQHGEEQISYNVYGTADAGNIGLEGLPEVTTSSGALEVVRRAHFVASFLSRPIPSDVVADYDLWGRVV